MEGKTEEIGRSHKPGLQIQTTKRFDDMVAGLKKKRETKIDHRRRRFEPQGNTNTTTSVVAPASFNKQQFLKGNLDQLRTLHGILRNLSDADDLDRYYHALFTVPIPPSGSAPQVIVQLVKGCGDKSIDIVRLCIECLINLTFMSGTDATDEIRLTISANGFFRIFVTHLRQLYEMQPTSVFGADYGIHQTFWHVLINMIVSNKHVKKDVLASQVFQLSEEGGFATSPFYTMLKDAFQSGGGGRGVGGVGLAGTLLEVIFLVLSEPRNSLPPWEFVFAVWPFLVRSVVQHPSESKIVDMAIASMHFILVECKDNESKRKLLEAADMHYLYEMLAMAFMRQGGCREAQQNTLGMYVRLSGLTDTCDITPRVVDVMIAASESQWPEIAAHAFKWAGNFMINGGTPYVQLLLDKKYIHTLLITVDKTREHEVRKQAIFALYAMFDALFADWRDSMDRRETAEGVLRLLVCSLKIPQRLVRFIHIAGDHQLVIDVMNIFVRALKWDKQLTVSSLRNDVDCEDTFIQFEQELSRTRAGSDTSLYAVATQVLELFGNDAACNYDNMREQHNFGGGFQNMQHTFGTNHNNIFMGTFDEE